MRKRTPLSTKPGAVWGSEKSGYRHEVLPGEGPPDRLTIPVAATSGRQAGRPTPSERRYHAGVHEVVDAREAAVRMAARSKGQLRPISGGLDDAQVPLMRKQAQPRQVITQPQPIIGDDTEVIESNELDAFEPGMQQTADPRSVKGWVEAVPGLGSPPSMDTTKAQQVVTVQQKYLAQRRRIMLELTDTTLTMSAIDVIVNKYSVTVLLPQLADGGTFIPRCGSELTISMADESIGCYFPGAHFEIPQLKLIGLTFIRKEEGT
jgi:hypothetical protein